MYTKYKTFNVFRTEEALWIHEIKPLFNSMKTLTLLFQCAMYLLELEIKLKKINKIYFRPTYPICSQRLRKQHF
jgi:hypothetical protein